MIPLPLFDTLEHMGPLPPNVLPDKIMENLSEESRQFALKDFQHAYTFLWSYRGSQATFNAYRRDIERCLQWGWLVKQSSILKLSRADIEAYLDFCQSPPKRWMSLKQQPRYKVNVVGERVPNAAWRPFVVTVQKSLRVTQGVKPNKASYEASSSALQATLAVLSTFYQFLIAEEVTSVNPVALIRQKSKYIRKHQGNKTYRRLSKEQWAYVLETCELMAQEDPEQHQRSLFIMHALYGMYLRISELAANQRWSPKMGDFHKDHLGNWWFTTVGKGNKMRDISVSDAMLAALRRYRISLSLSPLPTPNETTPLIRKIKGQGPVTGTRHIRKIVQACFDRTVERMREEGLVDASQQLTAATVHWLRHTGISDDVQIRPREHVKEDAGHNSSSTTDRYINVSNEERAYSAKNKPILSEDSFLDQ